MDDETYIKADAKQIPGIEFFFGKSRMDVLEKFRKKKLGPCERVAKSVPRSGFNPTGEGVHFITDGHSGNKVPEAVRSSALDCQIGSLPSSRHSLRNSNSAIPRTSHLPLLRAILQHVSGTITFTPPSLHRHHRVVEPSSDSSQRFITSLSKTCAALLIAQPVAYNAYPLRPPTEGDVSNIFENSNNNCDSTEDAIPQEQQQPEPTTDAFERVLSPETTLYDTEASGEDDGSDLSQAERRRRNFTFKLNSIELSVIEEKTDEDGSVYQQSPEKGFEGGRVIESSEKSREGYLSSLEGEDALRKDQAVFRTDSEGNEDLVNLDDDAVADEEPETADNEEDSSEQSLKGFEDVEQLLNRMPLVPTFKTLTRFRSFEYPRAIEGEDDSDEEEASPRLKKFNLKDFKSKMQSESNLDISEGDDEEEEENHDDDDEDTIVPDDDFDVDAAIDEVLEETSSEVQNEKWEMLKRTLHKIPYRANSFDLFGESNEDILENLFEQRRNKVLESAGEELGRSPEDV
ncbi:uncharacterized protein LOC135709399 [Ochlerotatus camptorhynchus]|uniref:uncharacterized protein LOC135709399 n=1 Tax=Ochlerotatus camptorhynchus TaxID=644619 RepID=UPI0031D22E8F